ncbi:MAG: acetyltransferase [Verrucomicrobia bacterium]|nr:acetyltransferase [Verrucomicrobiota bacterium]
MLVCTIADVRIRSAVGARIEALGQRLFTLIHPDATIGPRVTIGSGSILCARVCLTCDIEVGKGVIVNIGTSIGHNARIGDYSTLSGHCDVTGFSTLGNQVFMGSHASILPGVSVGDRARIGAGCIVAKSVEADTVWAIMPPRQIG